MIAFIKTSNARVAYNIDNDAEHFLFKQPLALFHMYDPFSDDSFYNCHCIVSSANR